MQIYLNLPENKKKNINITASIQKIIPSRKSSTPGYRKIHILSVDDDIARKKENSLIIRGGGENKIEHCPTVD